MFKHKKKNSLKNNKFNLNKIDKKNSLKNNKKNSLKNNKKNSLKKNLINNNKKIKGGAAELEDPLHWKEAKVMEKVKENGFLLEHVSRIFKNNMEIIKQACTDRILPTGNVNVFQFASDKIKNNPKNVLEIINHFKNGLFIQHASNDVKNNLDIFKKACLTTQYSVFQYLPTDSPIRQNREFILEMVLNNGMMLKYVDEEFKNDKDIVLAAIKQNGLSFSESSDDMQKDIEVAITAVEKNIENYNKLQEELQDNRYLKLRIISDKEYGYYEPLFKYKQFNELYTDMAYQIIELYKKGKDIKYLPYVLKLYQDKSQSFKEYINEYFRNYKILVESKGVGEVIINLPEVITGEITSFLKIEYGKKGYISNSFYYDIDGDKGKTPLTPKIMKFIRLHLKLSEEQTTKLYDLSKIVDIEDTSIDDSFYYEESVSDIDTQHINDLIQKAEELKKAPTKDEESSDLDKELYF